MSFLKNYSVLKNEKQKNLIYRRFIAIWNYQYHKTKQFNPCPLPVSLGKTQFDNLTLNEYYISEKLDGHRCQLLLCSFEGENVAVLIDRKLNMHIIDDLVAVKSAPDPTISEDILEEHFSHVSLFDCELVDEHLFVFDVICNGGINCEKMTYYERLNIIGGLFAFGYNWKSKYMNIYAKKCFTHHDFERYHNYYKSQSYLTDGYILTRNNAPISTNTCYDILKWKNKEHITIDILCEKDNDTHKFLILRGTNQYESIPTTFISRIDKSSYKISVDPEGVTGDCIYEFEIEFQRSHDKIVLRKKRSRSDKKFPNHRVTFFRTLHDYEDYFDISTAISQKIE